MYTNIRLVAVILVNISDNKSYAKPISDSINSSVDNSRLDSDSSLISSKSGSNTAPTVLP